MRSFIVIFSTTEARKKEKLGWRSKAVFKLQQFVKKAEQLNWEIFCLASAFSFFFKPSQSLKFLPLIRNFHKCRRTEQKMWIRGMRAVLNTTFKKKCERREIKELNSTNRSGMMFHVLYYTQLRLDWNKSNLFTFKVLIRIQSMCLLELSPAIFQQNAEFNLFQFMFQVRKSAF